MSGRLELGIKNSGQLELEFEWFCELRMSFEEQDTGTILNILWPAVGSVKNLSRPENTPR